MPTSRKAPEYALSGQVSVCSFPKPRKSAADTKVGFDIYVEVPCAELWGEKLKAAAYFILFIGIACEPEKTCEAVPDLRYEASRAIGEAPANDLWRAGKSAYYRIIGIDCSDATLGRGTRRTGGRLRYGLGDELIANDSCSVCT